MDKYLSIGIGGFIGSILRYQINKIINSFCPIIGIGTLTINSIGSFLIGIFSALIMCNYLPNQYKFFIITGFLGGFTTFSTFSLEITNLLQAGKYILSLSLIILNVGVSIIATTMGLFIILYFKNKI